MAYNMNKIYVLKYTTENLGDDIQSVATMDILDELNIKYSFINRDLIDRYSFDQSNKNYIIFNGWFTNGYGLEEYYASPGLRDKIKINWPPQGAYKPIFYSFHISEWGPAEKREVNFKFLNKDSEKFYKSSSMVGCRDTHTLNIMNKLGVEAYFSKCLTLSLNKDKYSDSELFNRNNILFVDVPPEYNILLENKIRDIYNDFKINDLTHKIISTCKSSKDRFNLARQHLKYFCNAKLVITTRLHVALPCLAFGTPVIFLVNDEDNKNSRIVDYLEYLNNIKYSQIKDSDLNKYLTCKYDPSISLDIKRKFKEIIEGVL